jgi:tripartite-type tricarboxylate transporter receptor subunit TctC
MNRRIAIASMLASAGVVLAPHVVRGQARFPERPTFARLIAAKIGSQRNVEFVVENRTGGNSTVGGLDVQRAAPDGYTVLFHASTHNVARLVMREVPYDPVTGFTPIALAGEAPLIHIIANGRPQQTVNDIVAAAKAKPHDWSFATAQLGAPGHLAEVAFNQFTQLNVPIVVYRGTAPAANDVVGGHVPMMIEAMLALLPLVRGGSVRAVAVTGKKRSTLAPDIPTMTELGLPGLDFGAWWAMWGPPGLPARLTQTLNGWVNDAVKALASNRWRKARKNSRNTSAPISIAAKSCSKPPISCRSEFHWPACACSVST